MSKGTFGSRLPFYVALLLILTMLFIVLVAVFPPYAHSIVTTPPTPDGTYVIQEEPIRPVVPGVTDETVIDPNETPSSAFDSLLEEAQLTEGGTITLTPEKLVELERERHMMISVTLLSLFLLFALVFSSIAAIFVKAHDSKREPLKPEEAKDRQLI